MNKINILKEEIFSQVNLYLKEIGELSPFGVKLINDIIKPVSYFYDDGNEEIESTILINGLIENISTDLKDKKIELGAVAYSVALKDFKHGDTIIKEIDALCIRYSNNGFSWEEEYYPYYFKNNEYIWGVQPINANHL